MNLKPVLLTIAFVLVCLPAFATDFITQTGDYRPFPATAIRVYEEEGKIQYQIQVGAKTGGPSKPIIEKGASWFIFPENDKLFWISPSQDQLLLLEMTEGGIKFSSSKVVPDLMDRAPNLVKERLRTNH